MKDSGQHAALQVTAHVKRAVRPPARYAAAGGMALSAGHRVANSPSEQSAVDAKVS